MKEVFTGDHLTITQEDRIAAGNAIYLTYMREQRWVEAITFRARILRGELDRHYLVLAFAQHRVDHKELA